MAGASPRICRSSETPVRMTLAVSGRQVALRTLIGWDDVLLAEGRPDDPALTLQLLRAVAQVDDDVDASTLPVPDADALILALRQLTLGDRIVAHVLCANRPCAQRVDVAFQLSDYLRHHRPKSAAAARVRPVADRPDPSWFALFDGALTQSAFRIPALGDLVTAHSQTDRAGALAAICLGELKEAGERRRARRALEALAPPLSGPIQGQCPDCGAPIDAHFEARVYCMQELCDRARVVYDDVGALAAAYHWSEAEILDLPSERRALYADRARQARAG